MTLVVARLTPLGIRLSADMRIVDETAARTAPGFLNAALKVIAPGPKLAIGYAGNAARAALAIKEVADRAMTPDDARALLLEVHESSGRDVDFIVASLEPSALFEIKNGALRETDAAWIGDLSAYGVYQRHYHDDHFVPPVEFFDAVINPESFRDDLVVGVSMNDAMQTMVFEWSPDDAEALATVGEATVHVGPRAADGLFGYNVYYNYRPQFGPPRAGESSLAASAERGTFTLVTMSSEEAGVAAVGVYLVEGQVGLLYAPLITADPLQPHRFHPVSSAEFKELVKGRYGIELRQVGTQ